MDPSCSVMTVLGPVKGEDLGSVFMNEHLICDPNKRSKLPTQPSSSSLPPPPAGTITLEALASVKAQPFQHLENLTLFSRNEATTDLQINTNQNFGALLDVTSVAGGRDPHAAKAISESLQIHVIIGTSSPGPSKDNSEPPNNDTEASQKDIEFMEQELLYGIETSDNNDNNDNATHICAGFIGEIEISKDFPPGELRQLKAAAVVQKTTNAPLIVAPGPHAIPVLDHIEACGATLPRVVLTHVDLYADNLPFLERVLDRGVVLCFDRFSVSYACWDPDQQFPTIPQVVHCVQQLLQHNPNYIHQIVLSNGVFMKLQYRKYGGWGLEHSPTICCRD